MGEGALAAGRAGAADDPGEQGLAHGEAVTLLDAAAGLRDRPVDPAGNVQLAGQVVQCSCGARTDRAHAEPDPLLLVQAEDVLDACADAGLAVFAERFHDAAVAPSMGLVGL